MPYKSKAQQKFFHAQEGKISKEVVKKFDQESQGLQLPNRKSPKAKIKSIVDIKEAARKKGY